MTGGSAAWTGADVVWNSGSNWSQIQRAGIYLAIFGQYPWERCPAVPPEIVLLPAWAPINLYEMSAWTRGIVVPLAVMWASKPYCPVPERLNIGELLLDNQDLESREPIQLELEDGVGLFGVEIEPLHDLRRRIGLAVGFADDLDDLV